jgi:hypothetical protein
MWLFTKSGPRLRDPTRDADQPFMRPRYTLEGRGVAHRPASVSEIGLTASPRIESVKSLYATTADSLWWFHNISPATRTKVGAVTSWICAECGSVNSTETCDVCGAPAPGQASDATMVAGPPPRHQGVGPERSARLEPADDIGTVWHPSWPSNVDDGAEERADRPGDIRPWSPAGQQQPQGPAGEPGPYEEPRPDQRRSRLPAVAAVVVAILLLAGGGYVVAFRHHDADPTVTAGAPSTPTAPEWSADSTVEPGGGSTVEPTTLTPDGPATPDSPEPPAQPGIVTVAPTVVDPRIEDIVAPLETYFAGINGHDYQTAASVLDPAGPVNPYNPEEFRRFAEGLVTTTNSDIVLQAVSDDADGFVRVVVTFRSEQEAGYGPKGRELETCTRWRVVYRLQATAGGYLIRYASSNSQACE